MSDTGDPKFSFDENHDIECNPGIGAWRDSGQRIIALHISSPIMYLQDHKAKKLVRLLVAALAEPVTAGSQKAGPGDWRKAAGFTQEQAADAIGISRTYMSQIERGEAKNLTLSTARKLAALYDCSVRELNIDL